MNQRHEIVVIGGGYAGVMAALNAAGRTSKAAVRIRIINPVDQFVERIRLHQIAAGRPVKRLRLQHLLRGKGIELVQGMVTQIDPDAQQVKIEGEHGSQTLGYDTLIYALGSTIDRDQVQGARDYADVLTGKDALRLFDRLKNTAAGGRVIICGGGLTGIEAAAEIAEAHPALHVSLLTEGVVGMHLSEKGRAHVRHSFARLGIELHEHTSIERITADAVNTSQGSFPYQVCVWAGAFSVPMLARNSGIAVNERGQILTDAYLRSVSHPSIMAAGDSAVPVSHPFPLRMACATAMPMGSAAGENAARLAKNQPLKPFQMAFAAVCVSLGRRDGLLQKVNTDDAPVEQVVSGWRGALMKEIICQYTRLGLRLERLLPGIYYYPRSGSRTGAWDADALKGEQERYGY